MKHNNIISVLSLKSSVSRLLTELKHSASARDLQRGKQAHLYAVLSGAYSDTHISNSLVHMYSQCGCLVRARVIFDDMPVHDVVSWNSLILGYAENGEGLPALRFLQHMQAESCTPNARTYLALFKACSVMSASDEPLQVDGRSVKVKSLERGMALHSETRSHGFDTDIFVSTSVIDLYAKSGSMLDARRVLERMPELSVVPWNALLLGYVENGECQLGLEVYRFMNSTPDARTFVAVLKACAGVASKEEERLVGGKGVRLEALRTGMEVHSRALKLGHGCEMYVVSALVDMYGKVGSLLDARTVFDRAKEQDIVTWTALIMGYVEADEPELALELFQRLRAVSSVLLNSRSFVAACKACTGLAAKEDGCLVDGRVIKPRTLERAAEVHLQATHVACDEGLHVSNSLVEMYTACGSMTEARRVFERMASRDGASWNSMIYGYTENGEEESALELFDRMDVKPSHLTYVGALKSCSCLAMKELGQLVNGRAVKVKALAKGREIHLGARRSGCMSFSYVTNTIMDMYTKCGSLSEARTVFDQSVDTRDIVSWNVMLLGYTENGEESLAMELYDQMLAEGRVTPDCRTYAAVLKACTRLAAEEDGQDVDGTLVKVKSLEKGMGVHSRVPRGDNVFVRNSLVDMYSVCGSMLDARAVFDKMECHDLATLTSVLLGYAESGEGRLALELYSSFHQSFQPDTQLYVALLKACASDVSLETGKSVHAEVCRKGLETGPVMESCLADLYGKLGSMECSRQQFESSTFTRELVTWNSLLAGYGRKGDTESMFKVFWQMQEEGLQPDSVSFVTVLTACSHAGLAETGKRVFDGMFVTHGVQPRLAHYHCLVDILGRANRLVEALELVKTMPHKPNAVTWRTLLAACSKWKNVELGQAAFQRLVQSDENDSAAYVLMAHIFETKTPELFFT